MNGRDLFSLIGRSWVANVVAQGVSLKGAARIMQVRTGIHADVARISEP